MYGAHHGPALFGEIDQQADALFDRHYVQSAVQYGKQTNRDELIMWITRFFFYDFLTDTSCGCGSLRKFVRKLHRTNGTVSV